MVRAVEQIEKEIAALDQTVATLAQAFYDAYQQYLTALGQAVRQQLVLAGYHICTHGYPEQFLALSQTQRQELQQAFQRLAKQAQADLLAYLKPIQPAVQSLERSAFEPDPLQLEIASIELDEMATSFLVAVPETAPKPEPEPESEPAPAPEEPSAEPVDNSALETESLSPSMDPIEPGDQPLHPKDIAHWQLHLEDKITELLQDLSHTANCTLQQAQILPTRLPEPVLEVAAKADLSSETTASSPNLLNLLIESEDDEDKPSMTQVIAIRLRLTEIEFGDATSAAHRSKLRQLGGQLTKIGREYQRKQKERAIAQAEAAWRSSWYEA